MREINPDLGPDPLNQLADGPNRRRPMARYEIHNIFREMVRQELARGELSAWRRRKLARYAASMQLTATEAGRLVREVIQADAAHPPPRPGAQRKLRVVPPAKPSWPIGVKLALVAVVVAAIQLILSALIF
jgi:hypothetical protein